MSVILFFFFFSSRRRHTRYWRDWSSDVCSSDLGSRNFGGLTMKLAKSLFLGSVAGLAAVAGAQAADLPAKKAAAVEYVRVCSTYGAGFFYIPGTETCLRVGGRVRAEFRYLEPSDRSEDAIGFR